MRRLVKLLTGGALQPAYAGVTLRAGGAGVLALDATDGATTVRLDLPATVRVPGEVRVSRVGLAQTVAGLADTTLDLTAEGSRLVLHAPGARFALPRLDADPAASAQVDAAGRVHPGIEPATVPALLAPVPLPPALLPPAVVTVPGAVLRAAAVPVCGAAAYDGGIPVFTGVRLRTVAGRLVLSATDRYRMAVADLHCEPAEGAAGDSIVDVLVPAVSFAEVARQVDAAGTVTLHADGASFGVSWAGGEVVTATLDGSFPDTQLDRLLRIDPVCTVDVAADALLAAITRATPYTGRFRRVGLCLADGAVTVRASDPVAGESEQTVPAVRVDGGPIDRSYGSALLVDALRPFAGRTVRLRVQGGIRATEAVAATGDGAEPDPTGLRYLVVPVREADGPA